MRIRNTIFCENGINLPYIIQVENPKAKIGIFGDSFAQLAEFKKLDKIFTHESSWIYYLANILNMECHTYGISRASMGDIFKTLLECETTYDYYIIFHTNPNRRSIFSDIEFNTKNCNKVKSFIDKKNVLSIYWNKSHHIFNFNKPYTYCNFHLSNKNIPDEGVFLNDINPLDQNGGHHHMSNRGNLLLAIELSKLMFATSSKN